MIVQIEKDEIFNDSAAVPVFGITDTAFLLLYNFYKTHSVENHYIVNDTFLSISETSVNLLRAYGIRFMDTKNDEMGDREYQLFIIPPEAFNSAEQLQEFIQQNTVPGLMPGYAVVEKDYTQSADYSDSELLYSVAPNIKAINPNFYKPTCSLYKSLDENLRLLQRVTNLHTGNKYNLINVSEYFKDFSPVDINFYISGCHKIIDSIRALNLSEDDILYLDGTISETLTKQAALHIAAFLFVSDGIKWEFFNVTDNEIFRSILAKARSNGYMFLSDYLDYLRNFPTFSVACFAKHGYLCVKDETLAQNKAGYGINLTLYRAKIDLKEWKLLQDFDKNKIITPLTNINQVKRLRDLSDIGSVDTAAATKALKQLSALFKEINTNLLDLGILATNELASINNIMIYTAGGVDYVAYVSNIAGKLPFVVKPTVGNYPAFRASYDVNELSGLHDVRLFYDAPKWYFKMMQALKLKETDVKHMHYDRDTIKGILLQGYLESNKQITGDCLSIAEVGVWATQTGSFRTQNKNLFFDLFDKKVALKNNMFTMFGVGHPQLGTNIVVTSDLWRYNNC